jgi:hypothetical protein
MDHSTDGSVADFAGRPLGKSEKPSERDLAISSTAIWMATAISLRVKYAQEQSKYSKA